MASDIIPPTILRLPSLSENVNELLKPVKHFTWKNPPAKPGQAYSPAAPEHFANIISHGVGPSLLLSFRLCF